MWTELKYKYVMICQRIVVHAITETQIEYAVKLTHCLYSERGQHKTSLQQAHA